MDGVGGFLSMGGYAVFIWPAYGVALVVLGGLAFGAVRRLRRSEADLAALEAGRPRRRAAQRDLTAEEAT
ncbi:MAG: heme exporter protein CcmD [Alphaproteobacteria bacterium]|nr:heme exporter protein CcmD [Alphaproteobacteria bacterium]